MTMDETPVRATGLGEILATTRLTRVIRMREVESCRSLIEANVGRILHFRRRITELGKTAADVVIVVINGDDPHGALLAAPLMPADWAKAIRERGEIPVARGLVDRASIQDCLDTIEPDVGKALRAIPGVAVVAVDQGSVVVFDLGDL